MIGVCHTRFLAANGHTESAIGLLRRAKEVGFLDFDRVRSDPYLRAVVADPRFESSRRTSSRIQSSSLGNKRRDDTRRKR